MEPYWSMDAEEAVMIEGRRFVPMISPEELTYGIDRVAGELVEARGADTPLMLCTLNGAAIFHADLIRSMPIHLEVDYIRVSSYHGELHSSGTVTFSAEPRTQMTGRHVILVEDIVDTGRTIEHLRGYVLDRGAASVEVVTLLYKRVAHLKGDPPEHVGFEIPDRFVVGYGLDYMEKGRNLPGIYVLDDAR